MSIDLRAGNCLDIFGAEPDASFDAFVSDWPAGVAFMGRAWDKAHGGRDAWIKVWAEVAAMMRRKAKPGAYSLTWALPRTAHWTMTALEDGGWTVQDVVVHVTGQGWPKGRSALKPAAEHWILARNGGGGELQIDAARVPRGADDWPDEGRAGGCSAKPEAAKITGAPPGNGIRCPPAGSWPPNFVLSHCPACEERGVRLVKGSAPASGPTLTGASSSGSRGRFNGVEATPSYGTEQEVPAFDCLAACDCGASTFAPAGGPAPRCSCGRAMWWACPVAEMDAQSGESITPLTVGRGAGGQRGRYGPIGSMTDVPCFGDAGGASRFFPRFTYETKAAGGERDAGCDDLYWRRNPRNAFGFDRVTRAEWEALGGGGAWHGGATAGADNRPGRALPAEHARGNVHPTVKSVALMEWLCSLVCPPGGRLGDVTVGSGGTAVAWHRVCERAGVAPSFLGADICPEAIDIARARLAWWRAVRLDVEPVKRAVEPPTGKGSQVSIFERLAAST